MNETRTRRRLREYLNGEWENMPISTRLALTVIAAELDGLNQNVRVLRRVVFWVGASLITSLLSLTVTLLAR